MKSSVGPHRLFSLPFTGERLISELTGQTEIQHLHRYLLAREFCRGKRVLNVASSEGYGAMLLAQVAAGVTGVDIAQDAPHTPPRRTRRLISNLYGGTGAR